MEVVKVQGSQHWVCLLLHLCLVFTDLSCAVSKPLFDLQFEASLSLELQPQGSEVVGTCCISGNIERTLLLTLAGLGG